MTAPLRTGDPIIVNVALGERSYDIVIGRGQLRSLGRKIAALRPGAKAAIVTRRDRRAPSSRRDRSRARRRRHRVPRP